MTISYNYNNPTIAIFMPSISIRQELPLRRQVAEDELHSNELAQLLLAQHRSKAERTDVLGMDGWGNFWWTWECIVCANKLYYYNYIYI